MTESLAKVTATDANREFSKVLERVVEGETIAITKRDKVVARIIPEPDAEEEALKDEAWKALIARLKSQPLTGVPRGTRDELYEDE